jgi:hypothetical protein
VVHADCCRALCVSSLVFRAACYVLCHVQMADVAAIVDSFDRKMNRSSVLLNFNSSIGNGVGINRDEDQK